MHSRRYDVVFVQLPVIGTAVTAGETFMGGTDEIRVGSLCTISGKASEVNSDLDGTRTGILTPYGARGHPGRQLGCRRPESADDTTTLRPTAAH